MASQKLRGILKFVVFSTEVNFYTEKETIKFNHLKDFLQYETTNKKGLIAFMTEEEFSILYNLLKNVEGLKVEKNFGDKIIWFGAGKDYKQKSFVSLKYKIGTDEFKFDNEKDIAAALKLIKNSPANRYEGYTSLLRKEITIEENFLNFHVSYKPSLSPMIFAKCNREFFNVKCRDACSFYPYLLTQELPHFKGFINKDEMDLTNKNKTYYGGLRIYNIKAKNFFYSISLIGKDDNNIKEIADGQGINIVNKGTSLISADKVIIFGWIPFLLTELQDYDFEYIELTDVVAEYELKIDWGLRKIVIANFETKQNKKRKGEDYKAEKVMLNRYYGFFITKGNKSAPAHYGQYIVAKGKTIIRRLALEIGLKDIVQGHTDSIKFIGEHQDVIDRYNSEIEFKELGKFEDEGIMERVVYYNTNRAKYLMKGKLGLKHGGISDDSLVDIMKMNYEDISINTEYNKTLTYYYDEEYGFYPLVKVKKFGGSLK